MSELEPTFLRLPELMTRLALSKSTIYREIKAGKLAPAVHGRWSVAEIKRYERACYLEQQAKRKAA